MSLWVSSGGPACRGWGGGAGRTKAKQSKSTESLESSMLAEHRRVIDVTKKKKKKKQPEAARKHMMIQCPCLSGQEKVEDYEKHVGWRTSTTQKDRGQMSLMP